MDGDRQVTEVKYGFEMPGDRLARVVVAKYGDGTSRREIEIGVDGRYVPRYAEIES